MSFYAVRFPDGMTILRTASGGEPRAEIARLREISTWGEAKIALGLDSVHEDPDLSN
ncbi:hypothetical protein [Frondihabitans sucicola]|nr:hypothetical protein [Frondihabitans sucicola]